MAIVIGIDEAGYGPILGPLVVSAATFGIPDQQINRPLWEILRKSLCKERCGSAGRVIVNDSKKLHNGRGRYERLQRGVLAFLAAASNGYQFERLGQLLQSLDSYDGEFLAELEQYPWYTTAADWPIKFDPDDITTAAAALANDMNQHDISLSAIQTRLLTAGGFNRRVDAVNNKADVLFSLICGLIDQGFRKHGRENLQILIDKQSGRSHYRRPLQKMFPELQLKILKEDDTTSSYQLSHTSGSSMKLHFLQKGDQRQLPIALASMASKYIRELFMEMLNAHFLGHYPDLAPTAGYYKDGRRFLADLESHNLPPHLAPGHLLIRQR